MRDSQETGPNWLPLKNGIGGEKGPSNRFIYGLEKMLNVTYSDCHIYFL